VVKQNGCIGRTTTRPRTRLWLFPFRCFLAVWVVASAVGYSATVIVLAPIFGIAAKRVGRLWMKHLLFFSGVRVKTIGAEKLSATEHYIFVANHQSYYDIPVLCSGLPFFLSFIAKKQLFRIPIFGWAMAAVGHIWIDRTNARKAGKSISRAVSKLDKGRISLVLFPEGTRSQSDTLGAFKRASFTLALKAGVSVVPVSIVGARSIMAKRSLRLTPGTVKLIVGDPIPFSVITRLDKNAISELVREKMIEGIAAGKNEVEKAA
jgi:1-acyl-sn-glycerol-3-phosphate acyltransferase